jgi:hypothetical protein
LYGGSLHQRPDVVVEFLLLRVYRLELVAQEHHCGGDVLPGPCKLWWGRWRPR